MTIYQFMGEFFALVWRIFDIPLPFFNLTIKSFLFGLFVCSLGVKILISVFALDAGMEKADARVMRRGKK